MRVVISGSRGFVGTNLMSILSDKNYSIQTIDIEDSIDLRNWEDVKDISEFDVFIHLANLSFVPASYENPALFYKTNYLTTLNALELCRKYNAKLIYFSSYVYGTPQYLPVDEKHTINPFNPYAQSKVICETLCWGYHRDFKIPIVIFRPFNIYGLGQQGSLLIPEIIQQLKDGEKSIQLKDPFPRRDYINIKDVVNAVKLSLDSTDNNSMEVYNLCSGVSFSVLELTEIINEILHKKVKFVFSQSDRLNEVNETVGTFEKIKQNIGWIPSISLKDGLTEILKHEKL